MLQRINLKRTELFELLSICALTTKQINFFLYSKKEAQHFKKYPLIQREKMQPITAGRPTYFMYVAPNKLSISSIKRGELLEKFVLYGRTQFWLFADFKTLSESTISVTIFDRQQCKQYTNVHLHLVINAQFKVKSLFLGKKNIFLSEDGTIGKRVDLQNQDIYFSMENSELKEVKKEKNENFSGSKSLLKSALFKGLEYYFIASEGDFVEELSLKFRPKKNKGEK
ncbi:hypothetical protein [Enterococcus sp. AZ192]|uniref:hypothetical protein n=1 Tax=unclassified Enterococcus TaxID=2608891 RepID=UPI003D2660C1